jgi:cbb3-type cytochrome oxidase maturation protein
MGILFLLTGLALAIFVIAVTGLIWSVRSGQLDDLDTPAVRLLSDEAPPVHPLPASAKDTP